MRGALPPPDDGRLTQVQHPVPHEAPHAARTRDRLVIEAWEEMAHREADARRRTVWIAGGLLVVCAAQAAAIATMLPLKRVEPYTLLVDRTTGYVETVRGVHLGDLPEDAALLHAFLAQYVIGRETFDVTDLQDRYRRVALWSAAEAQADWLAEHDEANPDAVINRINASSRVGVTVREVRIQRAGEALVRFETRQRDLDGQTANAFWQATITFRFTGAPMRMEDRLLNPLGFQVVTYRRDQEGAPLAAAPADPAGTMAATEAMTGVGGPEEPVDPALLVAMPKPDVPVTPPMPPITRAPPANTVAPTVNAAEIPFPIPLPTRTGPQIAREREPSP